MQHVEHLLEHDVVVRYLERTPHLAWTCPEGTKLEYVDVYVDSDWAAKETDCKSSLCVVIQLGQSVVETSSTTQGVISLEWRSRVR